MTKSIFDRLSFTECEEQSTSSYFRFEVVEDSKAKFSKAELAKVTKCTLLETKSKFYKGKVIKLLIRAKVNKKLMEKWVKVDGKTAKRYKDSVPCEVDPSMVIFYDLYDPEEEYGKPENNYSWSVCRVKVNAITAKISSSDDSDLDF